MRQSLSGKTIFRRVDEKLERESVLDDRPERPRRKENVMINGGRKVEGGKTNKRPEQWKKGSVTLCEIDISEENVLQNRSQIQRSTITQVTISALSLFWLICYPDFPASLSWNVRFVPNQSSAEHS